MYKVLITTSGTGSRLKNLTKNTNKALLKLNNKSVIEYIIGAYPSKIPLVITIGYYGKAVKEYLKKTYANRNITFVEIDKYEGAGSSLGYSMLQAKNYLQCPFIFHCNDTIIFNTKIPSPEQFNWNGGAKGNDPKFFNTNHYSSFTIKNGNIQKIQPKGAKNFDYLHIGLVGIKNYKAFWGQLEKAYQKNPNDSRLNDVTAIQKMLNENYLFKTVPFKDWFDTGNITGLKDAENFI